MLTNGAPLADGALESLSIVGTIRDPEEGFLHASPGGLIVNIGMHTEDNYI